MDRPCEPGADARVHVGDPGARARHPWRRQPTAGSTRTIQIAGRGGVPTTGAAAVAITLTGTDPDDLAYLTTWPTGTRPNASNLNLTPGQTNANTAIVPLAPDGTIQLYTSGRTHLLVDITAWIPTAT